MLLRVLIAVTCVAGWMLAVESGVTSIIGGGTRVVDVVMPPYMYWKSALRVSAWVWNPRRSMSSHSSVAKKLSAIAFVSA